MAINRSEIEELKSARNDEATKIAINLAKEAKRLNITTEEIERVTGIDSYKFIKYMKEETVERSNGQLEGGKVKKKIKPKIKPRGKTTRLPADYQSPILKENERLLKLLRRL